ncbi:MAG: HupE/UreJ family protein [Polyangiales bacterium]
MKAAWLARVLAAVVLATATPCLVHAHPSEFGVAHFRVDDGVGELFVRIPRQSLGAVDLRPVMGSCRNVEMRVLADVEASALLWRGECDIDDGGDVGFAALPDTLEIYLALAGGRRVRLTSDAPTTRVNGERDSFAFVELGVEHIAFGWDHLLFVLGLWLLAGGFNRRLLGVVTAFTLGHSITLAAASLGELSVDVWLVEMLIAGSIVLLGREAFTMNKGRPTLTQRFPAVVAAGFGLVHGLGFAGALKENGLPEGEHLSALFGFNLGVELGQLAFVLGVSALAWALRRALSKERMRRVLAYAVGSGGAFALLLQLT